MTYEEICQEVYIGDGVYASFDGWQIWLKTQEGHKIALEPGVFASLLQYEKKLSEDIEKFKAENQLTPDAE